MACTETPANWLRDLIRYLINQFLFLNIAMYLWQMQLLMSVTILLVTGLIIKLGTLKVCRTIGGIHRPILAVLFL